MGTAQELKVNIPVEFVSVDFARTLERELAARDALLREALADLVPKPNRYPDDLIARIRRALGEKG